MQTDSKVFLFINTIIYDFFKNNMQNYLRVLSAVWASDTIIFPFEQ